MGTSLVRLSSPRNQKQDQFTRYRLYCGFIILFTIFLVPFTPPRPHGGLLIHVPVADDEQEVGSLYIFIGLLFPRNLNPSIDRRHNARHRAG